MCVPLYTTTSVTCFVIATIAPSIVYMLVQHTVAFSLSFVYNVSGIICVITGLVKEPNDTSCEMLDRSDYEHIVWTAAAEFPGKISTCMTDVF